jgi:hypothetical protein
LFVFTPRVSFGDLTETFKKGTAKDTPLSELTEAATLVPAALPKVTEGIGTDKV